MQLQSVPVGYEPCHFLYYNKESTPGRGAFQFDCLTIFFSEQTAHLAGGYAQRDQRSDDAENPVQNGVAHGLCIDLRIDLCGGVHKLIGAFPFSCFI